MCNLEICNILQKINKQNREMEQILLLISWVLVRLIDAHL
jgi:hypothetical protein